MSQPSVSRHHADWLSLVEVSGPFVSLPVLMRVLRIPTKVDTCSDRRRTVF
jgi:hypothetical protein